MQLCLLALGISATLATAQTENKIGAQGRYITGKQILVLEKALATQPKGIIFIESTGFFPLSPNVSDSEKSEFEKTKTFSEQLWKVLKACGYTPEFPSGSHGSPPKGISIRVTNHKARPIADALQACLTASGIRDIRVEEDPKEEAYYLKYFPDGMPMKITIGSQ